MKFFIFPFILTACVLKDSSHQLYASNGDNVSNVEGASVTESDLDLTRATRRCGYFGDPRNDSRFIDWANDQGHAIGIPLTGPYFFESPTTHPDGDFEMFFLATEGGSSRVKFLRASIIELLERKKRYCIFGEAYDFDGNDHGAKKKILVDFVDQPMNVHQ